MAKINRAFIVLLISALETKPDPTGMVLKCPIKKGINVNLPTLPPPQGRVWDETIHIHVPIHVHALLITSIVIRYVSAKGGATVNMPPCLLSLFSKDIGNKSWYINNTVHHLLTGMR